MIRRLLLLFLISPAIAQTTTTTTPAPVWFTLLTPAQQSLTATVALPVGVTYRIGDTENNKWSAPVTTSAAVTLVDYADGLNGRPADPDPGTAKEFDVQEQATPQYITVNGQTVTVPALPPPPGPVAVGTFTTTCTLFSDSSISCAVPAAMVVKQ